MELKKAKVTNFRSVEDSEEFSLNHSTCLVGKNEAGKTALLQALTGLNAHPATPFEYNIERDYPKRYLARYEQRHPDEGALVLDTEWEIDEETKQQLVSEFGENAITGSTVTIKRRYNSEPHWTVPINEKTAIEYLIEEANLSAPEKSQIGSHSTSGSFRLKLEELAPQNVKHQTLLNTISAYPSQRIVNRCKEICEAKFPCFMYFSNYDRMNAEVHLEKLKAAADNKTLFSDHLQRGDRLFWEFLEYSGISLDEIMTATTFESFNSRLQSASNTLTDEILEYWTQNQDIEVRVNVAPGLPDDPAPFNQGKIGRARIYNQLHKADTSFSERSAGFAWFFSFLIKFDRVKKESEKPIFLLLDEPGLTLHGKAQADLLRYFGEKLSPHHQIIYTTHSPFMVPPDDLMGSRIVEDLVTINDQGRRLPIGTKVRDDVLSPDRDSVFPLQGALGYSISQTLFVGKHTILVEGPSDILYLKALSNELIKRNRTGLEPNWVICPTGGLGNIQAFVSLFAGNGVDVIALCDFAKGDHKKLEAIRQKEILKTGGLLTYADFVDQDEADVEDLFSPDLFCEVVSSAFELPASHKLDAASLNAVNLNTERQVKKMEAFFNVLPNEIPTYDHFKPSSWLIENAVVLNGETESIRETLDRAEQLFQALNALQA